MYATFGPVQGATALEHEEGTEHDDVESNECVLHHYHGRSDRYGKQ